MVMILAFILLNLPAQAHAACAPDCSKLAKVSEFKNTELLRIKNILQKNREYLQNYPKSITGVVIKIKSNILMCNLQIETLENQLTLQNNESNSKGCGECLTPNLNLPVK